MASTDIIAAIAQWTPSYDTSTWDSDNPIPVRVPTGANVGSSDITELDNMFKESDAPMRMIGLPNSVQPPNEFGFLALNPSKRITWYFLDRLYLEPTKMELGLRNTDRLYRYMDSYIAQIVANRSPTTCSHVVGANWNHSWEYWPDAETGTPYWIVDVILQIEEFG